MLVQRGYKVYVVDRPGHGRSSFHPDVIAPMGAPFPFEAGVGIFRSPTEGPMSHPTAHLHTQWPGTGEDDDPALEAIVAPAVRCPSSGSPRSSTSRAAPSCSTASGLRW